MTIEENAASRAHVDGIVYASHGHELMGIESPVRDRESQGYQYTK